MGGNSQNNASVPSVMPSWIKAELFKEAFKKAESEFKDIQEFKFDYALSPGENYASVMLKVEAVIKLNDNSSKPISFMLKVAPDIGPIKSNHIFDVEAGMYRDVVPELEQLFLNAGETVQFGPNAYELSTVQPYVLLENLKIKGFRNVNRLVGLDMIHVESVLKKLAQWHAASAVRVATKGKYPDMYSMGYIRPESYDIIKRMFDNTSKVFLECVKKYSNCDMYYEKLVKMQHHLTDAIFKTRDDVDNDEFKVLNHGDAWCNNIMFQYDKETGDLTNTYFIDYQIPCYSSPAQDLLYFIMTSCQYEIKLNDFDYMIAFYHKELDEGLRLLNYPKKIPTLKDVHCMMFKYGIWAYTTAINVMAIALCDPVNNANLDNFISETNDGVAFKRQMYSNPRYRKHMEAVLPWLLNRGILEYLK